MQVFEVPTTPKNENVNKKCILILKYVFLLKISFLGDVGTLEVCSVGMGWMWN